MKSLLDQATPLISIVLPTYNGSRWLGDAINSIINQTETRWELIIVDDCSTDHTYEIAKSFSAKDDRITLVRNTKNSRLPASLNIGFSHSIAPYRTWTSDDNLYKPNALRIMREHLDSHPDTDMIALNLEVINEAGQVIIDWISNLTNRRASDLSYTCNIGAAFMYRSSIAEKIGEYDTEFFCAEDYDYWMRIALNGKIDFLDNIIAYQYRRHQNSLTDSKKNIVRKKTQEIQIKYFEEIIKKYKFRNLDIAHALYNSHIPWHEKKYSRHWPSIIPICVLDIFLQTIIFPIHPNNRIKRRLKRKKIVDFIYSRLRT